jgi:hypothetical protein
MSRDLDLDAVFGSSSPAETFAAVLTEARMVLGEIGSPLDAELWGSDILAALGGPKGNAAIAIVPAAEATGTAEALAILRVMAAVGWPELRSIATQAADRMAAATHEAPGREAPGREAPGREAPGREGSGREAPGREAPGREGSGREASGREAPGLDEPPWGAVMGAPTVGECWRYGDDRGLQEAVTMSFGYGTELHVVSLLLDHGCGGGIKDVWVGDAGDVLERTRAMADQDPAMIFEMISPADARVRALRAIAAGECPSQPDEIGNVSSTRAILRTRVALLPRQLSEQLSESRALLLTGWGRYGTLLLDKSNALD